ncbi:AAA family ATPase [Saccharopolyspora erythraea]|uniref:MinD/ParA family ATP-binding protein n=1 Tax=Saccharopolyspora erythraea TaxID=1836 RepID=UPI001BAAC188|nr:MinD/ParA family protein [Saccharopolyspora erythraea]QUH05276.1 AAA family ATPase [Saccharopolyspora erythraea]
MTGRYEEPETQRDTGAAVPADGAGIEHATPDYGDSGGAYAPASATGHPASSYMGPGQVDPSAQQPAPAPDGGAPRPYYPSGAPQPGQPAPQYYGDPSVSGPQQPNFPAADAQSGPHAVQQGQQSGPYTVQGSGPYNVSGQQSGPYNVSGQQSGPYNVSGQQSGPYTVQGQQSGPYAVGGQSGPHSVQGQHSGPYTVQGQQSGPYTVQGSGPYNVSGQQSGPYPVQPDQSGQYPPGQQYGPPNPVHPGQPYPVPQGPHPEQQGPAQDLSSAQLLRQSKRPPQSGWRKAVYVATGRSVNLGESSSDLHRRELISRINQPLQGCYKIAMLSLKGGVGKTTTTATLGSTFSSLRGDRVIAVDANPDRGTLSQKIPLETTATVRHLLRDSGHVRKYSDVRSYTSQGPSRLEILASEQDPAVSEAFSEDDYRRTVTLLEHFYNIVLTDCGTGLMHSAMKGVLDLADSLVIVSSGSIDGARSASATLDWLDAHGYGALVKRSVAVINSVRPGSGKVDVDKLIAHFGSRCRAVSRIPFDPHLEEGAEVELDQLAPPTRMALLELAAVVADDFPHALGRQRQS